MATVRESFAEAVDIDSTLVHDYSAAFYIALLNQLKLQVALSSQLHSVAFDSHLSLIDCSHTFQAEQ